jgi:hypothetical protein
MAQNIILKRSSVSGKVPTTSSLSVGEIAINTFDGRVFLHVSSSSTESIQHIVTTNSITTGSINITQTGSFSELVVTQDGNFNRDIFVTRDIIGNGDLDVLGSFTASLQQGYVWVGSAGNISKLVATSSLSSAGTNTFDSPIYVSGSQYSYGLNTVNGTTTVIMQYLTSSYRSAFFNYYAVSGSNARAGQISSVWYNTTASYAEVATTDIGNTDEALMSVDISSSYVRLKTSTNTNNWNIKSTITLI